MQNYYKMKKLTFKEFVKQEKSNTILTFDIVVDPSFSDAAIKYSEYLAEQLEVSISYTNYIAENLEKNIDYTEYLSEQLNDQFKYYSPNKMKDVYAKRKKIIKKLLEE